MCVWVHEHCYQRVIFSKTIEGQGKWSSSRCNLVNCQRAKQPTSAYQSNKASLHYRTVQWNPKYIFLSQSSFLLSITFCSVPAAPCHCLCWWILKRNSQAKVNLDYFCSFESFLIQKVFWVFFLNLCNRQNNFVLINMTHFIRRQLHHQTNSRVLIKVQLNH